MRKVYLLKRTQAKLVDMIYIFSGVIFVFWLGYKMFLEGVAEWKILVFSILTILGLKLIYRWLIVELYIKLGFYK